MRHEVLLEKFIRWRRLRTSPLDPRAFHDSKFGGPICTPTHPMHRDPALIDLWPSLQVVNHARDHSLGIFADLDRRLTGARAIHGDKTDTEGQDCREAFRKVFLSA